ncbi:MAG TPA: SHOCT domain-containing protein [Propionicimonas sp.]|uniref:SHOCT domain-containing protein n=1 Tax=Propionicimonas sp. TaxID=1955623 RepID=UPI002F427EE9
MRRRNGRPGLIGTMARTAVIAGTATAVSGSVQQGAAQKQQVAAQQAAQEQAKAAEFAAMQEQVAALQAQQAAPPAAVPPAWQPPVASGPGGDLMAQLQQLASMHQAGILSDAEFAAAKAKLLA